MSVVTAFWLTLAGAGFAALCSLFFSSLTYALRDYSRPRLSELLESAGRAKWFDRTVDLTSDLIFTTALGRMFANLLILIFVLHALNITVLHDKDWQRYLVATLVTAIISLFCSVAVPHAIARHAGEKVIAGFVRFLHAWRALLLPATRLMGGVDHFVMRLAASASDESTDEQKEEEIQKEILSAVEEGEEAGVVDETEREMIESVIQFRATSVGQIMTPRPEIMALDIRSSLHQIKQTLEESGHSRIPMYEGTLDRIVGILYARDLLKFLGESPGTFDVHSAIRPPYFVPESKPLRDLMTDFRLQKVHIAIVLDEYGGTAGLVTIEDVLEEIVGEISDEHEPAEPAMFKRLSENTAEADARIYLDELNRLMGLTLPEDEGYDTLGGFVSTKLGRIPEPGTSFTHEGIKFTITDAEPQKVNRVKIELLPQPAETATNP